MSSEANTNQGQSTGSEPDIMQMLGHVPSMMQQTQEVTAKVDKQSEILGKLEKAFSKHEPQPDDWYDDVLKAALEAEKQGQGMPLTLKISNKLLEQTQNNAKLLQEIEQLKAKENLRSNPQFQMDQAAYNHIDQFMAQELERSYDGATPKHVAAAVTSDLVERIRYTQQNEPELWQKVRSNPDLMRQVVQRAVAQSIPPEARRVVQEQYLNNQTYSPDDMRTAIREAQEMLARPEIANNPKATAKLHESIEKSRQMLWESMLPGQNRRSRV